MTDGDAIAGQHWSHQEAPEFFLDRERISQHFLTMDRTASLLSVLSFMDGVETWTVDRFDNVKEDPQVRARLRAQLERLGAIIKDYQERIQPDNFAFVQVMGSIYASTCFYVLYYLSECQPDFFQQLVTYCQASQQDHEHASIVLRRIQALYRTQLIHRVFSKENTTHVMTTIFGHKELH
ncbi:hypothetical protein [Cupriavidus sp. TMH.W2]|uniref:type IVB secretion system protein IcmW n=1 Tax=Cupriavidus sp. TMH.W2 TaxID=3434465 RepID=UPI003D77328A